VFFGIKIPTSEQRTRALFVTDHGAIKDAYMQSSPGSQRTRKRNDVGDLGVFGAEPLISSKQQQRPKEDGDKSNPGCFCEHIELA
jgi:hypothetical protein